MKGPQRCTEDATPATAIRRTILWRNARAFSAETSLRGVPMRVPRGLHYFDLACDVSSDGRRHLVRAQLVLDGGNWDVDWGEVLEKSES